MKRARPGFHPVTVGLHWPSKPWGEEEFGGGGEVSFGLRTTDPVETLIDQYAERLDATPEMRAALKTIIASAMQETAPDQLPPEVRDAYLVLDANSSLESEGEGADPGADREPFDPDKVYEAAQDQLSFGGFSLGGLLTPLRTLTFWKMKIAEEIRRDRRFQLATANPEDDGRKSKGSSDGTQFRLHRCLRDPLRP